MIVYRISTAKYAKKLSASGAANRWNQEGEFVIYAAQSRSLATLELIVHRAAIRRASLYKIMLIEIDIPKSQITKINLEELPPTWRSLDAYNQLQQIGSDWYWKNKKLVLQIPSSVIPKEYNYIINTKHPLFSTKARIVAKEDFYWDKRLL